MASIYKRRKGKHEPYTIQYVDHLGKRRTTKGFTDKGLTEELAAKLESEARQRRTGLIDSEQSRIAEAKQSSLNEHLASFERSLADNTGKYVTDTMKRIRAIVAGCEFEKLSDIEPESIQDFLRRLKVQKNLSART